MPAAAVFDSTLPLAEFNSRNDLISQICQRLQHQELLSSSIVGGPKTGKTLLLRYLVTPWADAYLPPPPSFVRVYIASQLFSSSASSFDFWASVFRELRSRLQSTPLAAMLDTCLQRARDHTLDVCDLEDLFDACAGHSVPVVLLIDDFDALLKNANFWPPDKFLHVVRALGQRFPRGLAFVLATPRPLLDLWDPGRGASPYYNIFTSLPAGCKTAT